MFPMGLGLFCMLLTLKLHASITISDDDYKLLPQLYDMDDYIGCNRESNEYCKIKLVLAPTDRNNKLWQVIEGAKKEKRYIKRDVIYRAKCIPKEYFSDQERLAAHITELENRHLQNISFRTSVKNIKCKENMQGLPLKAYFTLLLLAGYSALVIFATVVDMLSRRNNQGGDLPKQKFVTVLSVLSNWESLRKPIRNADYNKLKCFQGFRIFIISIVVAHHSIGAAFTVYQTNTRLLEDFTLSWFRRLLINFGIHVIQSNFLMSGWFHTIQVYNAVERSDNKKLSLKVIAEALTSRYLRFVLPLIFYIGLTYMTYTFFDGPQADMLQCDKEACQTHWWANLLLINNFFYVKDMCNLSSWHMACDFQAYAACMALFYLMYKLNFGLKLFGAVLLCVVGVNAYIMYNVYTVHNLETVVTFPIRAEFLEMEKVFKNDYVYYFHTSFFLNFSSYLVGILFGAVYRRYKNTRIEVTKVKTVIWAVGFYGLSALVLALSLYEYPLLLSAIIGSLLKPLFSVGIGIGILGMSHNIGGFVKSLCEASPLEFMSRWIFSIYIFHLLIVYYKTTTWTSMLEMSYFFLIKISLFNIVQAIVLGLILHLVIERPLLKIIYMIMGKWGSKQKTK
ncbi:O-acyltransferase like protein-like isoform X1 [Anoplophora glabripennis]|uniref:O-acyltransferase like protein-like isoform X1 n=1 Tax=Anoplophora glabripennis TaxID=217634 RepID=UPI000873E24E|nr:O-acyltransferase like protein-like isoform X1 [Anoplophora glabripennis]